MQGHFSGACKAEWVVTYGVPFDDVNGDGGTGAIVPLVFFLKANPDIHP